MVEFPKVFVKHLDEDQAMKITFVYGNSELPDQSFCFLRSENEKLEATLSRIRIKIQNSITRKISKVKKKHLKDEAELPSVDVLLMKDGVRIDENKKNNEVWTSHIRMKINDCVYEIYENLPAVTDLHAPKRIMAGFPAYPKVILESCTKDESVFKWYISNKLDKHPKTKNTDVTKLKKENWIEVWDGFIYVPKESDVGFKLKVSCIPKYGEKTGIEANTISASAVQPGPGRCPFEDRHEYTKKLTDKLSLRFVSYNILADLYADSDRARNQLFPYCTAEALTLEYRKQLFLKEILGYNADIICLQEVDQKVFHDDLVPVLSTTGLKGTFNKKGGHVAEGLACLYRISKFKLIESHAIVLSQSVEAEPSLQKIASKLKENQKLKEKFMKRTTSLQVVLLESLDAPRKKILVGNTHLYFHPKSNNIRLIQAASCISYLENLLQKYQIEDPQCTIALILSGDFNSFPKGGVYKFITKGYLPKDCLDWKSNPEEEVKGLALSHSLQLDSACGTPKYTNYTEGFAGCIDYIFYEKCRFHVSAVVPFPTNEQLTKYKALPSKVFPSDHIALVCSLKWK
ncbi:2',5'-phosphodiesterase 12-like [Stegodyphus dumicola]|uniref:2',5'-phosphodiesterase 12-like n=1 Tax=Stegodyphus dumicola TaxID=202533 RepID=UPI0015AC04D6|nr:2',5'-phosphodiesterase 12-like [Stegodyphus dumicola]